MTAASTILTDVGYDLKLTSAKATTRQAELLSYMNRIIRFAIAPTLVRFKSDLGMTEWTTTETTAYLPRYSLPSGFLSFYILYCIKEEHSGSLASAGSSTSITLDSNASDSDDFYNGYIVRLTSGTYADAQSFIVDYAGSSVTATCSPAFSGTPSTDSFKIFKRPAQEDELVQVELALLNSDYTGNADYPEVYAIDRSSYIVLGPTPDGDDLVLYGWYFSIPSALTASTSTLPYNDLFNDIIRAYTTEMGLNRDEYNVKFEEAIRRNIEADVISILRERARNKPAGHQAKIVGSNDW